MKNFYIPFVSRIKGLGKYFNNIGMRLAIFYTLSRFVFLLSPLTSSLAAIFFEALLMLKKIPANIEDQELDQLTNSPRAINPQGLSYYIHDPTKGVEVILDDGIMVVEHD